MDDPNSVSPIEIAFLERYLQDREAGLVRELTAYQELFAGHDDVIADAYARVAGEAALDGEGAVHEAFAHFRLLRKLGQGGQGVVWLAEDERLQRQVALKLLSTSLVWLDDDQQQKIRARFEREAAVAARLDDPGLCKVHEVGEHDGVPWISMQFVEGRSLDQVFGDGRRDGSMADRMRRVVALVEAAARAVHEAHEAGLVHRDLKPGNIMVTPRDRVVVLDFGIAYDDAASATLTATGQALGSPAYMAPEQIAGDGVVDRRVDVYALGVTLFEGLAGHRPFEEPTRERLFEQIRAGVVPRLRNTSSVSTDLEVVVGCAMDRSVDRRYRTTLELADDLARVLRREPIRARPVSTTTKAVRWAQRNPMVATMAVALFLLVGSLAGVFAYEANRRGKLVQELSEANQDLDDKRREAQAARDRAARKERAADWNAYVASMRAATSQRRLGDVDGALQTLAQCKPELRGVEWQHELLRCDGYLSKLYTDVPAAAVDPTGRLFAVGRGDGSILIVDASSYETMRTIAAGGQMATMAFDPMGEHLVVGFVGAPPKVWSVQSGELVFAVAKPAEPGHEEFVPEQVAVAEGVRWVVVRSENERIRCWGQGGEGGFVLPVDCVDMAVYGPDTLAMATAKGLTLLRVMSKQSRIQDPQPCISVAAMGDDRTVAIGTDRGQVFFYDWAESSKLSYQAHGGAVTRLRYGPGAAALVSTGADSKVAVQHFMQRPNLRIAPVPSQPVSFGMAADGARVLQLRDGSLYECSAWGSAARGSRFVYSAYGLVARPDRTVVVAGGDGRIEMIDADSLETEAIIGRCNERILDLAGNRDGSRLVTGDQQGYVRIWDVAERKQLAAVDHFETYWTGLGKHRERWRCRIDAVSMSDDGERVAALYQQGPAIVFDANSGDVLARVSPHREVSGLTFLPDSYDLLMTTARGLQRFDAKERVLAEPWPAAGSIEGLTAPVVSPGGEFVAAGSEFGVLLWSLSNGGAFAGRMGRGEVGQVAFSPDARRLVASYRGTPGIRIYDPISRDCLLVDTEYPRPPGPVVFAADGKRLFSGGDRLRTTEFERMAPAIARDRALVEGLSERSFEQVHGLVFQRRLAADVLAGIGALELEASTRQAFEKLAREIGTNVAWLREWSWPVVFADSPDRTRLERAHRFALEAQRLTPDRPHNRLLLGCVYYRLGEFEKARRELELVRAKGPFRPFLHGPASAMLAMVHARTGDAVAARRELDRAPLGWQTLAKFRPQVMVEATRLVERVEKK